MQLQTFHINLTVNKGTAALLFNPLAPELFFLILAHLYTKCE